MNVQDVDRILAAYRTRLAATGTVVKVGSTQSPGALPRPPSYAGTAASADDLATQAAMLTATLRDPSGALRPVVKSVDALDKIVSFLAWSLDERRTEKIDLLSTAYVLDQEAKRLAGEIGGFLAALRAG